MRFDPPTRRRLAITVAGLLATAALASSCSLDAAVETDTRGRVIGLNALRVQSGALDLAVALALEGSRLVLELRWRRDPVESAALF